ncbi:cellulase family glycosylhydrolase [Streptomyces sp. NPDC058371]|uniref:cellulase family glycosylhydrolase n=1 Tax=Streptomyces sp. NPDC058371 TaxID=3346463 RepID=UPI0036505B8E
MAYRGVHVKKRMPGIALALLTVGGAAGVHGASIPADAAPPAKDGLWFDDLAAEVSVDGTRFVDGHGREVVLRGFNVSGEVKLEENGGLPFASTADARKSAEAMREQAGANSVRFLLSWAKANPEPGKVDEEYLAAATAQIKASLDAGLHVFPDFHQDLYSRYLFNQGSWYQGDGAPKWVVQAGGYSKESCGVCAHWGQNITQNKAVTSAHQDFWRNREVTTPAGIVKIQDAFLDTAEKTMKYVKGHLPAESFELILGFDPLNEPHAGTYESGETSKSWEKDRLWPFYQRFRARMDAAGWQDKPAFVEPNLFWNSNIFFSKQEGGLQGIGTLGSRYVFNTHFYDQAAMSGIFMPGKASDGRYVDDFKKIRDRSTALDTAPIVSEFGHHLSGSVADKAPTVLKGMYQSLDSRLSGADWWKMAAESGPVVSSTQWQWDIYSGRHNELMNDNPDKVLKEHDAWNEEDLSTVGLDDSGSAVLRQDARLIDRLYPGAVAGRTLAFSYEDRSRDGSKTLTWNPVPSSMPSVARLVAEGQYGVLVWRSGDGTDAPTELHLPRTFASATTTVVSDIGTLTGPPAYSSDTPIATAAETGGTKAHRLLLTTPGGSGLHYALVTNGTENPSPDLRAAAQKELAAWVAASGFTG